MQLQVLKILFITDIHLRFDYAQKLSLWHQKNKIQFDLILVGGDTANCDQNGKTHDQQQQLKEADQILSQIQQTFGCKMYLIPGNHDPLIYYQKNHKITPNIESIHERTIEISKGLEIVGFGGSVPGYLDNQATKQVWKGYPFESNQALTQYCKQENIFDEKGQTSNSQRIYLTHCGPFEIETSIDRRVPTEPIYGGAKYFDTLIEHQNLLLYLHGHVHSGSKFAKVNQIPIINPGALSWGQFGYFCLEKESVSNIWKVESTHFVQL